MQKKFMFKILSVFMLAMFVMSMAAAAKSSTCKANADTFSFSASKYTGNVLSNDKGEKIKVISTSKTTNKGKVTMKTNGYFSYKPASTSKTTIKDSFSYTIADRYGKKSTAQVTINYKKSTVSASSVVSVTKLSQIDSALKKGPVLLEFGATWCPHCKALAPTLKKLAKEYSGKATIMSVDTDKSSKLADSFEVSGIPDCCVIVGTNKGKYVYMQNNGKTTTVRSKAIILGEEKINVYEKVLNYAVKK